MQIGFIVSRANGIRRRIRPREGWAFRLATCAERTEGAARLAEYGGDPRCGANTRRMKLLALLVFVSVGLVTQGAQPTVEEIDALLGYVKQLDGAVFIRNGTEHAPAAAEAHLRMKWEKQAGKIKSAEDFIALCATKSSMSGERYRIRLKDGAVRDSAELLREELARRRTASQRAP